MRSALLDLSIRATTRDHIASIRRQLEGSDPDHFPAASERSIGMLSGDLHDMVVLGAELRARGCRLVVRVHGLDELANITLDYDSAGAEYYNGEGTDDQLAARFGDCVTLFLRAAVHDLDARLSDIPLIDQAERDTLDRLIKGRSTILPLATTIVDLFEVQAAETPDNTAVACLLDLDNIYDPEARTYLVESATYAQLDARSNQIAHALAERGFGRGDIVGVAAEHPIHRLEAVLGVLKAGAAYLPLDGRLPSDLREQVLGDAGVRLVIGELTGGAAVAVGGAEFMDVQGKEINRQGLGSLGRRSRPDDLCYVCLTSGTTSRMKGVSVLHRGLLNYVAWRREALEFSPRSVILQMVPFSADGFCSNAYPTLIAGGLLVMVPEGRQADPGYVLTALERFAVTGMSLVPSSCKTWIGAAQASHLCSIQYLVLAGELASDDLLMRLQALAPNLAISNEYGPTEATVGATFLQTLEPGRTRVIGRPIDNVTVTVMTGIGEPAPVNVPGEICISGAGLARGYLNEPELTERSFVTGPDGERLYRTGDWGIWSGDGDLLFLGRIDRQAKLRGRRIEIGYLERRITEVLQAEDAHVRIEPRGGDSVGASLIAYVALVRPRSAGDLRSALVCDLPDWMVPDEVVAMKRLPRDGQGRIDSDVLARSRPVRDEAPPASLTPLESRVADLFARVLRLPSPDLGGDANFFDLGGHSIALTQLAALIHAEFHVNIKMSRIFQSPTIAALARIIAETGRADENTLVSTAEKAFYVASPTQQQIFIAHHRGGCLTAYNTPVLMRRERSINPGRLRAALCALIDRHEALRTAFTVQGNQLCQVIAERPPIDIEILELSRDACQARLDALVRPFMLDKAPLLRVTLLRVDSWQDVLLVDSHHIVMDARSLAIVLRDLMALHDGMPLPAPGYRYRDFSESVRLMEASEGFRTKERFWLSRFPEMASPLNLPCDHVRPKVLSLASDSVSEPIDPGTVVGLSRVARSGEATLSAVFLTLFVMLLAKWTGERDVVIGLSVSGRTRPELEEIVGNFTGVVPLRCAADDTASFRQLLNTLKYEVIEAYENQDYTLSHLVRRLGIRPNPGGHTLVNTLFQFVQVDGDDAMPILRTRLPLDGGPDLVVPESYVFDLVLDVVIERASATARIGYSTALFKRLTASALLRDLLHLAGQVEKNAETPLFRIELPTSASAPPSRANVQDFLF
jgi:amino acid adenylation domain-containing protein